MISDLSERGIVPDIAVIGEPTEMRVIEGHKGCFEYTTRFTGLEGHGSAPDAGVNAAEYAARYVSKLLDLREALKTRAPAKSQFEPPWTTLNVGRIAGGVAHNVIVGKAEVDWEMRPVQNTDADFVKSEIAAYVSETLIARHESGASGGGDIIGDYRRSCRVGTDGEKRRAGAGCGIDRSQWRGPGGLWNGGGAVSTAWQPRGRLWAGARLRRRTSRTSIWRSAQLDQCCRVLERLGQRLTR